MIKEKVCGTCKDYRACIDKRIIKSVSANKFYHKSRSCYEREQSNFKIINRLYLGLLNQEIEDSYDPFIPKLIVCLFIILKWLMTQLGLIVYNLFVKK